MENAVELRQYVEALLSEKERATEAAERERDKAASALAIQLAQQIEQGDRALRDHIEQQIQQLQIMLDSTRREIEVRSGEQQKAISKSEVSSDKRFESVNAFRAQLNELVQSHQIALSKVTSTLMPREVAEAQIAEVRKLSEANRDRSLPRETFEAANATRRQEGAAILNDWTNWRQRIDTHIARTGGMSAGQGEQRKQTQITNTMLISVAVGMVAVLGLIIAFANYITTH